MTAKIIPFQAKEPVCAFCKTPKSKCKNLVGNNENGKYICDVCLAKCTKLKNQE